MQSGRTTGLSETIFLRLYCHSIYTSVFWLDYWINDLKNIKLNYLDTKMILNWSTKSGIYFLSSYNNRLYKH